MKIKQYTPQSKLLWYKNKKLLTSFIGIMIIILMISSALTFFSEDNTEEQEYNDYVFINNNGIWLTTYENQRLTFEYSPKELEYFLLQNFDITPITYLVLNKPYDINQYEVQRLTAFLRLKGVNVQFACLPNQECQDDTLLVASCEGEYLVMNLKQAQENSVVKENNCITLNHGDNRVIDRISYKILGIMD